VISTSSIPKQTILCIDNDEVMLRYEKAQRESLATQFSAQCHGASAQACDYVSVRRSAPRLRDTRDQRIRSGVRNKAPQIGASRHHGIRQRSYSKEVDHGRRVHT
jgi:hypothetical protein